MFQIRNLSSRALDYIKNFQLDLSNMLKVRVFELFMLDISNMVNKPLSRFLRIDTAWKVSVFRVILVRIFPHSDWIRRYILRISPYSGWIWENTNQNNSEWTLFTQWEESYFLLTLWNIFDGPSVNAFLNCS